MNGHRFESPRSTQTLAEGLAEYFTDQPYLIVRTIWRCSRQHRRWPWADNEQFMDRSLAELRQAFGIRVAHESRDAPGSHPPLG